MRTKHVCLRNLSQLLPFEASCFLSCFCEYLAGVLTKRCCNTSFSQTVIMSGIQHWSSSPAHWWDTTRHFVNMLRRNSDAQEPNYGQSQRPSCTGVSSLSRPLAPHCTHMDPSCLGLARTIYIQCVYGIFGREITKYMVIYGVHTRFWPTLSISFA